MTKRWGLTGDCMCAVMRGAPVDVIAGEILKDRRCCSVCVHSHACVWGPFPFLRYLTAGSSQLKPGNPGCPWWAIQLCPQSDNLPAFYPTVSTSVQETFTSGRTVQPGTVQNELRYSLHGLELWFTTFLACDPSKWSSVYLWPPLWCDPSSHVLAFSANMSCEQFNQSVILLSWIVLI